MRKPNINVSSFLFYNFANNFTPIDIFYRKTYLMQKHKIFIYEIYKKISHIYNNINLLTRYMAFVIGIS